MAEITDPNLTCVVCGTACKSSCGGCKKVSYCGKTHQKEHWRVHKKECFPLTIQSDPVLGRHITGMVYTLILPPFSGDI